LNKYKGRVIAYNAYNEEYSLHGLKMAVYFDLNADHITDEWHEFA